LGASSGVCACTEIDGGLKERSEGGRTTNRTVGNTWWNYSEKKTGVYLVTFPDVTAQSYLVT
jgi:hypothetical protein